MSAEQFAVDPSAFNSGDFNSGNVFQRIGDFFTGRDRSSEYNSRSAYLDKLYEQENLTAARKWAEYMDSTQVQRRVEDIKKAGLNPWLAINNGFSASSANGVGEGGSAKNWKGAKKGDNPIDMIRSIYKDMMDYSLKSAQIAASMFSSD